jgi:uncharacterized protein (DUF1684 family)
MPLASDENGEPTVLSTGTVSFFVIGRGDRIGVRVRDGASVLRRNFRGLEHYPVSSDWRFDARFIPYPEPKHVTVPTILGFPEDDVSPGEIEFTHGGKPYRLVPILEQGSDEMFVIFGDRTNGKSTYGGGRFVYAPFATRPTTLPACSRPTRPARSPFRRTTSPSRSRPAKRCTPRAGNCTGKSDLGAFDGGQ